MNGIKRDKTGQFAPGTTGGPGRPPRVTEREYMRYLSAACPPERWQRIVEKAASQAELGDAEARKWLAKYLLGERTVSAANAHETIEEMVANSRW